MKQGGLYQNKVNSSLASIFNYKMGYSKEQRWILNSTGLPKLQEITELFRNKNTATWRPSSLQFRHKTKGIHKNNWESEWEGREVIW